MLEDLFRSLNLVPWTLLVLRHRVQRLFHGWMTLGQALILSSARIFVVSSSSSCHVVIVSAAAIISIFLHLSQLAALFPLCVTIALVRSRNPNSTLSFNLLLIILFGCSDVFLLFVVPPHHLLLFPHLVVVVTGQVEDGVGRLGFEPVHQGVTGFRVMVLGNVSDVVLVVFSGGLFTAFLRGL